MPNVIKKLTGELVRRNVLRALGTYGIAVWLLAQGLVDLLPAMGFPNWAIQAFLVLAAAMTPVVAVVAWKYDLTSKGFLRDRRDVATARKGLPRETIGPTATSLPRMDNGRSILNVSWVGDKGDKFERRFSAPFVIGRDYQAEVRLRDDCVSRLHVQVYPEGEEWLLKDLDSLNGTYVSGEAITVKKISPDVEVSLDKDGPKVRLTVLKAEDTLRTTKTV